ncbi:hypothetical protein [Amycolatopsis sp.]|uniref:hypothetical protein n=1 Tax=Amycolatopsis sp. TaxID=37632 RepID=UPI002D7EC305|nr:hypothetical protein [Amycolatopsis sp.]HET6710652.1 hypothetical protein [Amycolatopsis sp.]
MATQRGPNDRLRVLLDEARWTGGELARAVNAVAAESGLDLNYRRASAAQWLSGGCPRPPVPELIAEALSRELNRAVTPSDAGFGTDCPSGDEGGLVVPEQLGRLAESTSRRNVLRYSAYRLALLTVPVLPESAAGLPPVKRPAGTIGQAEIEAAGTALRLFSATDCALGAGAARVALADYLANTVSPWLRAGGVTPDAHRELQSVAAELAYLCGFMCFDDELHGPAQRYFRAALRLAAEAGDGLRYAMVLRVMSVQARALGHRQHAWRLAETAMSSAPAETPQQAKAFLLGQVAVAAASVGDRERATTALAAAERALARAAGTSSVIGAYHYGSLAYQRAATNAGLGDKTGAVKALRESIRLRPLGEYRSLAITQARLAELSLDGGRIDDAVAAWNRFLDIYPTVRSGRTRSALRTLQARTRSHQRISAVKKLSARASALQGV